MIAYCRDRGTKAMRGQVLQENEAMLQLAKFTGFESRTFFGEGVIEVTLPL